MIRGPLRNPKEGASPVDYQAGEIHNRDKQTANKMASILMIFHDCIKWINIMLK